MNRILLIVALEEEFRNLPRNFPGKIAYSGVGKINASHTTTYLINEFKPDLVLNFGSAGRVSSLETGIFEIGSVIERDFMAMPLSERGIVPFDEFPHELISYHSGIKCATGDSFVTKKDPWLMERKVDVVDMELFAIAKVSKKLGVPWRSFKYITDDTNESSGKDWKENLVKADGAFQLVLEKILSKTIY